MSRRRLAYLGTPDMAVPPLRALVAAGHEVVLVVTGADKRRGRGSSTSPSPVKAAALELGLRVSHDLGDLAGSGASLGVVVAFGRIIPADLLVPPLGFPMLNLHFSLLPRWRGAAPVERALLAGDAETGVCVMRIDEGLDTGPVLASRTVPIGPRDTAAVLRARLVGQGTDLLLDVLSGELAAGSPQQGTASHAPKIAPSELRIDWTAPPEQVDRLVRVGGAWTTFRGRRVRVLESSLDDAAVGPSLEVPCAGLRVCRVQPEGRGAMAIDDFLRGVRPDAAESYE